MPSGGLLMGGHAFPRGAGEAGDEAIAAFRALILADAALHAPLGAIERPDDYVAATVALAAANGIALPPAAILDAMRPDPLAISRFLPCPVTLDHWPARGWLPARTVPTEGAPSFDWLWFGEDTLDAPFFDDMIRRVASRPFNLMFRTRTSLAALVAGIDAADGPAPSGFIHHMSRCGSTLVAQMLAADASHVVLSEAEPLDGIVRWAMESAAPLHERVAALRAIVAALGRDRSGGTRRVFFKLDSWHVMALPLFRAAFPETPWAYLYRDPTEVLVSQQRSRGLHTVAGMLPTSLIDIPGAEGLDGDHYASLVVQQMGEAVLQHWPLGGGLLVNYGEMPQAIVARLAPHCAFVPDARQRAAMAAVAQRDAKDPGRLFVADSLKKQEDASSYIRSLAHKLVDDVYSRLESLRTA